MGSGVFDLMEKTSSDSGLRGLARAEGRGGREAPRRARPGRGERDRVPPGPRRAADPGGASARRSIRAPAIADLALARGRRRVLRVGRGVPAARRGGVRAGATVDVEHDRGLLADASILPDRAPRHRLAPLAVLAPGGLGGSRSPRCRRRAPASVKLVARSRRSRGEPRASRDLQRSRRGDGVADLSDGTGERARPRPLGARPARRSSTGPSSATRPPASSRSRDLLDVYEVDRPRRSRRSSASSAGASRARSRRASTTRSSARATCRTSTCRSRSPTSIARSRTRSRTIRRSAASPSRSPGSSRRPAPGARPRTCARPARPTRSCAGAAAGARRTPTWTASSILWPTTTRARAGRAVIVGAGGAARAAVVAARRLGYEVAVAARRDAEADRVAAELGVDSIAWRISPRARRTSTSTRRRSGGADDDPPAIPRARLRRAGRSSSTASIAATDARPRRSARRARANCPTVDGLHDVRRPGRAPGASSSASRTSRPRRSTAILRRGRRGDERAGRRAGRLPAPRRVPGACVPVARVFPSDLLTPVMLFSTACAPRARSASSSRASRAARRVARYTFLGCGPVGAAGRCATASAGSSETARPSDRAAGPSLAPSSGSSRRDGFVRGSGAAAALRRRRRVSVLRRRPRSSRRSRTGTRARDAIPDGLFLLFDAVAAFDHPRQRLLLADRRST